MKLKDHIETLQKIFEVEGNLELVTSADDDGNYFNRVYFSPSVGIINANDEFMSIEQLTDEAFGNEDVDIDDSPRVVCLN